MCTKSALWPGHVSPAEMLTRLISQPPPQTRVSAVHSLAHILSLLDIGKPHGFFARSVHLLIFDGIRSGCQSQSMISRGNSRCQCKFRLRRASRHTCQRVLRPKTWLLRPTDMPIIHMHKLFISFDPVMSKFFARHGRMILTLAGSRNLPKSPPISYLNSLLPSSASRLSLSGS